MQQTHIPPKMTLKDKFDEVRALTQNWDDHGAIPIKSEIIESAEKFLSEFSEDITDIVTIDPMTQGRLALEWNLGIESLTIQFQRADLIKILVWTLTTEKEVVVSESKWNSIKKIIKEFCGE